MIIGDRRGGSQDLMCVTKVVIELCVKR
jgi:hypothetical protein